MTEYQLTKKQLSEVTYKATQLAAHGEWTKLIYCAEDITLLAQHLEQLKSQGSPGSDL